MSFTGSQRVPFSGVTAIQDASHKFQHVQGTIFCFLSIMIDCKIQSLDRYSRTGFKQTLILKEGKSPKNRDRVRKWREKGTETNVNIQMFLGIWSGSDSGGVHQRGI